ncbi:MAG: galactose-1-phosphate uridylyltransferase [Zestosphaera sp.]
MHEIRWNPLIKQWVIIAPHRATRPWRPGEESTPCPFCPGAPELKQASLWDVVVLPNKYPALTPSPPSAPETIFPPYKVLNARGVAEVVVETPQHEGDLHTLTLEHAWKVVKVYKEEFEKLSKLDYVNYVAVFRNKGKEVGVSLPHPHSQIYALPFIPSKIEAEIEAFQQYWREHNNCILCDILSYESTEKSRVIYENEAFTVLLPFYAMWPYELHVYAKKHVKSLNELSGEDLRFLADALRVVTATYATLLKRDAPYIMVLHNHPSKGSYVYHFHVEFYQPYRDEEKLKYAAGIEWGYWVFTYDGVPEEKASELKDACRESVKMLGDVLGQCF